VIVAVMEQAKETAVAKEIASAQQVDLFGQAVAQGQQAVKAKPAAAKAELPAQVYEYLLTIKDEKQRKKATVLFRQMAEKGGQAQ
jgi:hypothetical protein